jgi:hypothetical protein
MEKDQEPPFPRESWQRLLQDRADAPPETTDARIRAAARKAVAPKPARWWLPASLAASFLLAVLIVQTQFGNERKPAVVTEKDLAAPTAAASPPAALSPDLARELAADSAAPAQKESVPSELHYNVAPEDFPADADAESDLGEVAATGSRISGPEHEMKAASEMDAEADVPPAPAGAESADAAHEGGLWAGAKREAPVTAASAPTAVQVRTPEAWYAEIETLRKAGRNEEADAELARFEAAYPDWLKQHDLQ